LSSRTGFICLGIFLVVHVLKNALQRQFFNISLSAAALLVSGLVYFGSNVAQSRVKGVLELSGVSVKKKDVTYRNSIDSRLIAWKCSTELIASNLGGYGIGDSQDELVNSYKAKGEVFMQTKNFNSHNQFLTTSLSIGVFGFVLLVLLFFILLARAWNQGDWVLGLVTLLLVLNFMTESMLERAEGTTFIPLILCILVFRKD